MNKSDLLQLYRFSDWATARVTAPLHALSDDDLRRDLGGSFRSIRDLLAHVAGAEWVWLERFRGGSPTAPPDWYAASDAHALADRLLEIGTERFAFVESLDAEQLALHLCFAYLSGRPGRIPLADALFHVANHATYHRGQLAWMLRTLGATPPATDYVVFLEDHVE